MARPESQRLSLIVAAVCFALGAVLTLAWLLGKTLAGCSPDERVRPSSRDARRRPASAHGLGEVG